MNSIYLYIFLVLGAATLFPVHVEEKEPIDADKPHLFRENKGQWKDHINYFVDFGSVKLWLEDEGFTWKIQDPDDLSRFQSTFHPHSSAGHSHQKKDSIIKTHVVRMKFENAQKPLTSGIEGSESYSNYFKGNDPSRWASYVRDYETVNYQALYTGIDMKFYTSSNQIKYDFIVQPGADPSDIRMKYEGHEKIFLDNGSLVVENSISTFKERPPFAYQMNGENKVEIPCSFVLKKNIVSFQIGENYNPKLPLVIDPELVFSSFTGSTGDNFGMTATPGVDGALYGGGIEFEPGYPTTTGSYDDSYGNNGFAINGSVDIAITKFSSDGTQNIFSTYIGGTYTDIPHSLIENSRGELVILGSSSSEDYPTTSGAIQRQVKNYDVFAKSINRIPAGPTDIVITVLNPTGSGLIGSTYLGGSENDGVNTDDFTLAHNYGDELRGEVVLDDEDNIYVGSITSSTDFPTTDNVAQPNYGGGFTDGVVFSVNRQCTNLRFSTYYGGGSSDAVYSIKIRSDGGIYMVGGTKGRNLFMPASGLNNEYIGKIDGFISMLSPDRTTISHGTYIGTEVYDQVYFVDLDNDEFPYIYGQSLGVMPFTQGKYGQPRSGQFVQKLNKELTSLEFGITFGKGRQNTDLSPTAFLVDECNRIYLSGWGGVVNNSPGATEGFDVSNDAYQQTTDGSDFYLLVLEENASSLLYATYFGGVDRARGDHVDGGTSRFAKDGTIYHAVCAACGGTNNYPTTEGVVSETNESTNCNLGVFKFDFELSEIFARAAVGIDTSGCFPYTVDFNNTSFGTTRFEWDFGDGNTSTERTPSHEYQAPGTYQARLIALSTNICIEPDTAYVNINVKETVKGNSSDISICEELEVSLTSTQSPNDNTTYQWNTGETGRQIDVSETGQYIVFANYLNCIYPDTFNVTFNTPEFRLDDYIHCDLAELVINLDDRATDIVWSTGEMTRSISVSQEGEYWVNFSINDCMYSDTGYIAFPIVPIAEITGDTLGCPDETITLVGSETNGAVNSIFQWSTGESTPTIDVTETGTYTLIIEEELGCRDTVSQYVRFYEPLPELEEPEKRQLICEGGIYIFDLSQYEGQAEILWSDGNTEFVREFDKAVSLTYEITNICEALNGSIEIVQSPYKKDDFPFYIPNAFSPNEDGINDIFKPEFNQKLVEIIDFSMLIYDRWGNLIFESRNINSGWDGSFKQLNLDPGVYVYDINITYFLCEGNNSHHVTGDVQVLR